MSTTSYAQLPLLGGWGRMACNGSKFCTSYLRDAGGSLVGGVAGAVSSNGADWSQIAFSLDVLVRNVYATAATFVAFNGSTLAETSPDGVTWTSRTLPVSASGPCAVKAGRICALRGGSTNVILTSDDGGATWASRTLPSIAGWSTITATATKFYIMASGTTKAASSTDGITWTARTLPFLDYGYNISSIGELFCAKISGTSVATSADGITWGTPTDLAWYDGLGLMNVINGRFVLVSATGNYLIASGDGQTWAKHDIPIPGVWVTAATNDAVFCFPPEYGDQALVSDDLNFAFLPPIFWTNFSGQTESL